MTHDEYDEDWFADVMSIALEHAQEVVDLFPHLEIRDVLAARQVAELIAIRQMTQENFEDRNDRPWE